MAPTKKSAKIAQKNLKINSTGEKWKLRYKEENKKRSEVRENLDKTQIELREAVKKLETEQELRVSLSQKVTTCELQMKTLSRRVADSEATSKDLADKLNSVHIKLVDTENQLHLAKNELEQLKSLKLLRSLSSEHNISQEQTQINNLLEKNKNLEKALEEKETGASQTVQPMNRFSYAQSHYIQTRAVQQAVSYMKSGALTSIDYNHLLRRVVDYPAFPGSPHSFRLSAESTFIIRSSLHLSDADFKKMKKVFVDEVGYDPFASRQAIGEVRKHLDKSENYEIEIVKKPRKLDNGSDGEVDTICITIKNLEKAIAQRLEVLDQNDLLLDVEDKVTVCLLADKGSDEAKLCVSIENVAKPNSPNNLMLVGVYEGADDAANMSEHWSGVLKSWDHLKVVKYRSKTGDFVEKRLEKKLIGDLKFLYAVYGHKGAASSHPCHVCTLLWCYRGSKMLMLKDADFSTPSQIRTLTKYQEDAITGRNSVYKDSKVLCAVEPINAVLPTIHITMGLFGKYFQPHINGQVNFMDRKDPSEAKTLKDQKKEFSRLKEKEAEAMKNFDELQLAEEEALCACRTYRIIKSNPIMHLTHPQPLCESNLCIINHLGSRRSTDDWIRCDQCQKYFHFSCSGLFSPEEKVTAAQLKFWSCEICNKTSTSQIEAATYVSYSNLTVAVQNSFAKYTALSQKRSNLESVLFGCTGKTRRELESFLARIGCDVRTWYGTYGGNQVRRILRPENIDSIFDILSKTPENLRVKDAMNSLSMIMTKSGKQRYSDSEIDDIEIVVDQFLTQMKSAFPKESVTPKLHLLGHHLIPFMRQHHSWGRTSEQGMEHLHSQYNILKNTFKTVKSLKLRANLILQELTIHNWLFDNGVWTD
ncbi:hypothetical protein B9Z55_006893 [Caenorhabditis nigoni]|uniref:Zinc finger PHD-type domain-containing protein n=1 Tax=Caenorhabditis nigoni TaxID=1611254 RepID=A0A2G5V716_9PELO|nr:hypothetical protein B9Z55_006893 [Caenorhabditis nigoni]